MKRDDLTGLAMGGNKGRKLEYLMADVLAQGAEVVVTCGSSQSNFIRQLGACCSMHGVRCIAAIMSMPYDVTKPEVQSAVGFKGNLALDRILGIDLRTFPDGPWEELYDHAESLALESEQAGAKTYRIPVGGSSALGAYAFVEAAKEITREFDVIVFASSSGSTHTGLSFAYSGSGTRILGIACDPEPDIASDFAILARELKGLLPHGPDLVAADYDLNFDFVGPGYGIPSTDGNSAVERMARSEGIFLDPIYTGKAFAGLLSLVDTGEIKGRVLFWHTGGIPALFV